MEKCVTSPPPRLMHFSPAYLDTGLAIFQTEIRNPQVAWVRLKIVIGQLISWMVWHQKLQCHLPGLISESLHRTGSSWEGEYAAPRPSHASCVALFHDDPKMWGIAVWKRESKSPERMFQHGFWEVQIFWYFCSRIHSGRRTGLMLWFELDELALKGGNILSSRPEATWTNPEKTVDRECSFVSKMILGVLVGWTLYDPFKPWDLHGCESK